MAGDPPADLDFWPRITRFYGITPLELQKLPGNVRQLYIEQMGEIEAEEGLMALLIADYPGAEAKERAQIHGSFKRAAGIEDEKVEVDVTSETSAAALAGMGIGLKIVKTSEDEGGGEDA